MILNRMLIGLSLAGSLSLGGGVGAAFGGGEHGGWIEDIIALNRAADTKLPLLPPFRVADLPRIFAESDAYFSALRTRVAVETPDPYINAAVAA